MAPEVLVVGVSTALLVLVLLPADGGVWERRLRTGRARGGAVLPRLWPSLRRRLTGTLRQHAPGLLTRREQLLVQAGLPERLAGAVVLTQGLVGGGLALGLSLLSPGSVTTLVLWAVGAVLGWRLPLLWLTGRAEARQARIRREIPEALDLLRLCVVAGDGLEMALRRLGQRLPGPLGEELARVVEETRLGRRREEALAALRARVPLPEMGEVVATLLQADRVGGSIAEILQAQAETMRRRRLSAAEEQAARAAVTMLFPLVFCIFPALLVVVLGPAALRIVAFFQTTGAPGP